MAKNLPHVRKPTIFSEDYWKGRDIGEKAVRAVEHENLLKKKKKKINTGPSSDFEKFLKTKNK